ncbi:hypothetical protein RIVM261_018660 [Rivularia sp. IAM M-261]|nr:hypothetical protein CAL7716_028720 [Calothrix sp. PCC 7716]GJD16910.1 hypothetical protein RIVM261_018660 [Rivularia sp. IAM M-261]
MKRQSVKYNVLFFLAIPHTVTQREAVIAGVLVTTHLDTITYQKLLEEALFLRQS